MYIFIYLNNANVFYVMAQHWAIWVPHELYVFACHVHEMTFELASFSAHIF